MSAFRGLETFLRFEIDQTGNLGLDGVRQLRIEVQQLAAALATIRPVNMGTSAQQTAQGAKAAADALRLQGLQAKNTAQDLRNLALAEKAETAEIQTNIKQLQLEAAERRKAQAAIRDQGAAMRNLHTQLQSLRATALDFSYIFGRLARETGLLTAGAVGLGVAFTKSAIDARVHWQQAQITMASFLGSATQARDVLADLRKYSLQSPFDLRQTIDAAKLLIGYGFPQQQLRGNQGDILDVLTKRGYQVGVPIEQISAELMRLASGNFRVREAVSSGFYPSLFGRAGFEWDSAKHRPDLSIGGPETVAKLINQLRKETQGIHFENIFGVILSNIRDAVYNFFIEVGDIMGPAMDKAATGIMTGIQKLTKIIQDPKIAAGLKTFIDNNIVPAIDSIITVVGRWLDQIAQDPDAIPKFLTKVGNAVKTLAQVFVYSSIAAGIATLVQAIASLLLMFVRGGPIGVIGGIAILGGAAAGIAILKQKIDDLLSGKTLSELTGGLIDIGGAAHGAALGLGGMSSGIDAVGNSAAKNLGDVTAWRKEMERIDKINRGNQSASDQDAASQQATKNALTGQGAGGAAKDYVSRGMDLARRGVQIANDWQVPQSYFDDWQQAIKWKTGPDAGNFEFYKLGRWYTETQVGSRGHNGPRGAPLGQGNVGPFRKVYPLATKGRIGGYQSPAGHSGWDIFGAEGEAAYASVSGILSNIGHKAGGDLGGYILPDPAAYPELKDKAIFFTHLNPANAAGIKSGQRVSVGDVLGYLNATQGRAAGGEAHDPHVHIGVVDYKNGRLSNPDASPYNPGKYLFTAGTYGFVRIDPTTGKPITAADLAGISYGDTDGKDDPLAKILDTYAKAKTEYGRQSKLNMSPAERQKLVEAFDKQLADIYVEYIQAGGAINDPGIAQGAAAYAKIYGPMPLTEAVKRMEAGKRSPFELALGNAKDTIKDEETQRKAMIEGLEGQKSIQDMIVDATKKYVDGLQKQLDRLTQLKDKILETADSLAMSVQNFLGNDRGADLEQANQLKRKVYNAQQAKSEYIARQSRLGLAVDPNELASYDQMAAAAAGQLLDFGAGLRTKKGAQGLYNQIGAFALPLAEQYKGVLQDANARLTTQIGGLKDEIQPLNDVTIPNLTRSIDTLTDAINDWKNKLHPGTAAARRLAGGITTGAIRARTRGVSMRRMRRGRKGTSEFDPTQPIQELPMGDEHSKWQNYYEGDPNSPIGVDPLSMYDDYPSGAPAGGDVVSVTGGGGDLMGDGFSPFGGEGGKYPKPFNFGKLSGLISGLAGAISQYRSGRGMQRYGGIASLADMLFPQGGGIISALFGLGTSLFGSKHTITVDRILEPVTTMPAELSIFSAANSGSRLFRNSLALIGAAFPVDIHLRGDANKMFEAKVASAMYDQMMLEGH